MPSIMLFLHRRKHDDVFRKRTDPFYSDLKERAARKRSQYDWEGTLALIAKGQPYETLVGGIGVPPKPTWQKHMRRDPAFRARVEAAGLAAKEGVFKLRQSKVVEKLQLGLAPKEIAELPGLPSRAIINRLRLQRPDFKAAMDAVWEPRHAAQIYLRADRERVLKVLSGALPEAVLPLSKLPTDQSLQRWAQRDPEFRRRLLAIRSMRRRGNIREDGFNLRLSLSQNEVWAAANAAVSRSMPDFIREDVISEMVADILEGHLDVSEIKLAAKDYVTAYHRDAGTWASRSMDAAIFRDSKATLHDRL